VYVVYRFFQRLMSFLVERYYVTFAYYCSSVCRLSVTLVIRSQRVELCSKYFVPCCSLAIIIIIIIKKVKIIVTLSIKNTAGALYKSQIKGAIWLDCQENKTKIFATVFRGWGGGVICKR